MADITLLTGNWSSTGWQTWPFHTIWDIPPTQFDNVHLDASCTGNITIDVPAVCASLDTTAYIHQINFNNPVTIGNFIGPNYNFILDTNVTVSGSIDITMNGNNTGTGALINSIGVPIHSLTLKGQNAHYILGTNWNITGDFLNSPIVVGTNTINSNTITVGGNLFVNNGNLIGTTNFIMNGSALLLTGSANEIDNSININSSGTITLSNPFNYGLTGAFTITSGTVVAPNGNLRTGLSKSFIY